MKYFIQTYSTGEGVTIHTDDRWVIRIEDIYYNVLTSLCIVEYLNTSGKMTISRMTFEAVEDISITKLKDK